MADIVIDYELLDQLGKDTDTLKNKVSDARQANHHFPPNEVGGDASIAIDWYYQAWKGAFKHAWDLLESLSGTYTTVAQQWFDQDAQYAATGNEQALGFEHSIWWMQKQDYDNWKRLSETYVTVHGFDKDGNPYEKKVPLADPDKPPALGPEPDSSTYTASDGSQHTTTYTYDSNGNVTTSNTTITDSKSGLSYHESTTFGANGSYTSTVNHGDGSTTVEDVQGDSHGNGTRTETVTSANGDKTVTVYTGTGINGSDPQWTKKDDNSGGNNGNGNGNHDGGGSHPTAGSHQQQ